MVESGVSVFQIYWPNILFGAIAALSLSALGCHLLARRQILQALVLSQAASFGIIGGAVILIVFLGEHHHSFWELCSGFAVAGSLGWLMQRRIQSLTEQERPDWYLSAYIMLAALSFWLLSYFPALESHLLQSFFGDLVTLSRQECLIGTGLFILGGIYMYMIRARLLEGSAFQVLGHRRYKDPAFEILVLSYLVLGTYFLGFLLTMSFLLLPGWLISRSHVRGLKKYFAFSLAIALVALITGFASSLFNARFSTTPSIILSLIGCGALVVFFLRWSRVQEK